jgi:hypothetical protein
MKPLKSSLTLLAICCLCVGFAHAKDNKVHQMDAVSAIQVDVTTADDGMIPAEFRYAIFEQVVKHLEESGTFQRVFRTGDKNAVTSADVVTLHTEVVKFKEGSQMKRELVKVAGATKVDLHVTVTSKAGQIILDKTVTGKVRFMGENLNVTRDLGKVIAKLLKEHFKATGTPKA